MKKILILNGSHSEIPLICAAKELGYYVITSGNRRELIGHKYSDEYVYGDYSDQEAMLQIAVEKKIDTVCACANDFGAISAAYIASKLGLPGHDSYETTLLLHQKDKFKAFAREHNLLTPPADVYQDFSEAHRQRDFYSYPLIVKPVDLTGGKGVSRVNRAEEYDAAVEKALHQSRAGKLVVERFIEGTYHSFSTFLIGKKVAAYFSDNEFASVNPFAVATSGGPARQVDKVKDILIGQAEIIADRLSLVDGVFHMQYVMDKGFHPYIIDITRRCSGDMYPEPVEHATRIPWAKWIVLAETGADAAAFTEKGVQTGYCGRHCIMASTEGRIKAVWVSEELKENIYQRLEWWKKGDLVTNHRIEKLGILFLEFSSEAEMNDKLARIGDLVWVELE